MSQRERPAPRGRPANGHPPVHPAAHAGNGAAVSWNDLYDRLPPDQRARLLADAVAGVISADRVPPPPAAPPPHLLHRLLNGDGLDDLLPLANPDLDNDSASDLDPSQRAAVSLALRTPDVALIQGRAGLGQERVAAAAITAAVRRGERVLLMAANPAGVDRVLNLLTGRPEVCALRCLGRDESANKLPVAAANCTFAAHTQRLTDDARQLAQIRIAAAVETCRRRDAEAAVFDHLLELAEQHHRLLARQAELPTLRDGIVVAVEQTVAEPAESERERSAVLEQCDADLAARRTDAARARDALTELEKPLAILRPLAAARASGRWWTPAWWRARSAGDVATQLSEVEAKHRQAENYAVTIEQEVERIAQNRDDLAAEIDRDRFARRQTEIARRRAALDDQSVGLDREMALVADKWQQAVRQLPATGPRPAEFSSQSAATARDAWSRDRDTDRRNLEFARAWADGLEPLLEALPGRFLESVNFVAATPAALAADRHFGDGRRGLFDMLIVLDAQTLSDGELLAAARRARRWVLLGGPTAPERGTNGSGHSRAAGRGGFARLWHMLHCDPWGREGERVVCRLRPVPPDGRGRLQREPVADRPDIELRIHTPLGGTPELAEMAFPAGTAIARAVEYVFAELGELPAGLGGEIPIAWAPPSAEVNGGPRPPYAILAAGVRALIADSGAGWMPTAVEFDQLGWDRERAVAWVRRHVVRNGPGRAVRLETPS